MEEFIPVMVITEAGEVTEEEDIVEEVMPMATGVADITEDTIGKHLVNKKRRVKFYYFLLFFFY
jgi:hypothetical protein